MKNYNEYINKGNNINDLYDILYSIARELELNINSIFVIENNKYSYDIRFKNLDILTIKIDHYINIKLQNQNCASIKNIKINNPNLKDILKEKIIAGLIITLITFNYENTCYNLNITLNDSIDEIVNKLIQHNKTKEFINAMKKNYLPPEITNKYNYLLSANNFDLI